MEVENLERKFEAMGARLKVGKMRPDRLLGSFTWSGSSRFRIDVKSDRKGEFFELMLRPDVEPEFLVLDVKPKDRHLLLMVRDEEKDSRSRVREVHHRYLCGHDERAWFVAAVPGASASSVAQAKEALKPPVVRESQVRHQVKTKDRNRRRNVGFIRQGEWFFVPCPDLKVDERLVLPNEPLRRGRGKPHTAEFLYRLGGTTVYVCRKYPNGLTRGEHTQLIRKEPDKARLSWTTMARNPEAYVKGWIRHPDHKTIVLTFWHRVVPNRESETVSGRNLAFLD